jgi:hypothetical protein
MLRKILVAIAAAGVVSTTSMGQSIPTRTGPRKLLARDVEIALARSAAPASVSANARVLILADTGFVLAVEGSNGVTCIVNRSWPTSLEPHCFDAEASATILPIELRRTVLYQRGIAEPEVERDIARMIASGEFRAPRRPAMTYMMSEGQQLVGDDGKPAGRWRPHIMIYYPYLKSSDVGFGRIPDMKVGMVTDEATPTSSLMIVMPQFIPVAQTPQ